MFSQANERIFVLAMDVLLRICAIVQSIHTETIVDCTTAIAGHVGDKRFTIQRHVEQGRFASVNDLLVSVVDLL